MEKPRSHIVVIAGPDGSGKTTVAPALIDQTLGITDFVNADVIAKGLSAFRTQKSTFRAVLIMLEQLRTLAQEKADFAFEIPLARTSFAPWINNLRQKGYWFTLIYLWLPSPELAIARANGRVQMGGFAAPQASIQRRYYAGLKNFFQLYRPIADTWFFYDNSSIKGPRLMASQTQSTQLQIVDPMWQHLEETYVGP